MIRRLFAMLWLLLSWILFLPLAIVILVAYRGDRRTDIGPDRSGRGANQ